MQLKCTGCGATGNIADSKIPDTGANVKCPKCGTRIFVKKSQAQKTTSESGKLVKTPPVKRKPPVERKPPADHKPPSPPVERKPPADHKPPVERKPPADHKPPVERKPPADHKPPSPVERKPPADHKPSTPVKPEKPPIPAHSEPPPIPRKPEPAPSEPQKSAFVTVISWISIVLSGLSCFQSIIVFTMMPNIKQQMMNIPQFSELAPQMGQMMFSFLRYASVGLFILSSAALVSSIGLLKRKNWARIIFIIFLSLGIAWSCLIILQQLRVALMIGGAGSIGLFGIGIGAGFSFLFGRIIKELVSEKIKAEFVGEPGNYKSKNIYGSTPQAQDEIISEKVTKWAYYIPSFIVLMAIFQIPVKLLDARYSIQFAAGFVLVFVCANIGLYILRYKPKFEFPGGGIIYKGVFQNIKVPWSDIKMLKKRKTGMYGFWEVTCDTKKLNFNIYKNHPSAGELEKLIIEKGILVDG